MCPTSEKLEMEVRSHGTEAHFRYFARKLYLECTDSPENDAFLAFVDQAVAEAELLVTEARWALDEHKTVCRFCAMVTAN
jgi:hypothetical protein